MDRESFLSQDWIKKAEEDMRRVEIMLNAEDFGDAGFHFQQAVEKYLKAYLLIKGWELEKTHDLVKLLNYAIKYDAEFERFVTLCETATEYYIEERYPFILTSELTKEEIEANMTTIIPLIDKIEKEIEKSNNT